MRNDPFPFSLSHATILAPVAHKQNSVQVFAPVSYKNRDGVAVVM